MIKNFTSKISLLIACLCIFSGIAFAGGASFEFEILKFSAKAKDQYFVDLKFVNPQDIKYAGLPKQFRLHLRYYPQALSARRPSSLTRENYLTSVSQIKDYSKSKQHFFLGFMGCGFKGIKGRKNEYQSNALEILTENDGRKVIYSFACPI